ncbi:hypothetical protein BHF71_07930 [Vulcanibacillus modesticaldus]|uniref:DAGKc domain-containing protein n=1 Tax=Vulcanibacillus modesticaldus TaxID=337097 RepID=A0A1D2YVE3_9BACI|nr:hypothetical protein BHF71_07930 [Vulcanibacillus modesticaldus]
MYIIINPISGKGSSLKIIPKIKEYLDGKKIKYKEIYTQYEGHATEIAEQNKNKADIGLIIVVSGDGTLNEVINGWYPSQIPIGYIPSGTGNDYAREMGIPKDPILALERILKKEVKKIDIGRINDRYFINVASMGFDGEVAHFVNNSKLKRLFGKLVYVFGVLRILLSYNPKQVKLVIDDKIHKYERVWLVAVANNRFYGGGMAICPNAQNNDGQLDICIIKDITRLQLLRLFPLIFSGKHIEYPMIEKINGKKIEVYTDDRFKIQADGEIFADMKIKFEIIKKALNVV